MPASARVLRASLILALPLFALSFAAHAQDDAAKLIAAALEQSRENKPSAAMADLQSAVAIAPQNPAAWYQLGLLLGQIADFRAAESALRRAIALKPDFPEAHYSLGVTLIANPQRKLDWPAAIAEFRQALKFQPGYAEAHNLLGAGLTAQGDLDAAISELRQAVHLKPSLPEAHFNLALALEQNALLADAVPEYQAAIAAKSGDYPEATTALAELFAKMAQPMAARQQLAIALRANPDLLDAHHALAGVLQSLNQPREAGIELRLAADLSQRAANAIESAHLSNQGLDLAAQGDFRAADATLRQAILLRPDYGIPHFNLGLVLADQQKFPAALDELTKAISLLPAQAKPWFSAARVLRQQGDLSQALAALLWAAQLAPGDAAIQSELSSWQTSGASTTRDSVAPSPPALGAATDTPQDHLAYAQQLLQRGDALGAVGELLRSLTLQPAFLPARRALAGAYRQLADPQRAILEYYKILDMTEHDAATRALLGQTLLETGDPRNAAEEFRIALIDNPDSPALRESLARALGASHPLP